MDDIPKPLPLTPVKFMDRFRAFIRARHMAYRTEKTYCIWVRDFIRFQGRRHPETLSAPEVDAWLSYLANERQVAINTQKTALNAVVFMYHQFLGQELGKLQFTKTARGRRLPTVFSHSEALTVLGHLQGAHRLAASLMYGSGLRVMEAVRLRVQDVDFGESCLIVRETKGDKWRRTLLPRALTHSLQVQIECALAIHRTYWTGMAKFIYRMRWQKNTPAQPAIQRGSMFSLPQTVPWILAHRSFEGTT